MREIKFRIWWPNEDGNGGQMIDNPYWEFKKLNDGFRDMTNWVFMQYTGLPDKNSKEIYEGDIVKLPNGGISEVKWNYGEWNVEDFSNNAGSNNIYNFLQSEIEIIGNIYSNPELLDKSK